MNEIAQISVEDPNDKFQLMRDKHDVRLMLSDDLFKKIKAPVSKKILVELMHKYKLTLVIINNINLYIYIETNKACM